MGRKESNQTNKQKWHTQLIAISAQGDGDELGVSFDCPLLSFVTATEILLSNGYLDCLQSLKQFFMNVSYYILVASLTLMALS